MNYGRVNFMKKITVIIQFVHVVPIDKQMWQPWTILNSDWLSFQKFHPSEITWPDETKLNR